MLAGAHTGGVEEGLWREAPIREYMSGGGREKGRAEIKRPREIKHEVKNNKREWGEERARERDGGEGERKLEHQGREEKRERERKWVCVHECAHVCVRVYGCVCAYVLRGRLLASACRWTAC